MLHHQNLRINHIAILRSDQLVRRLFSLQKYRQVTPHYNLQRSPRIRRLFSPVLNRQQYPLTLLHSSQVLGLLGFRHCNLLCNLLMVPPHNLRHRLHSNPLNILLIIRLGNQYFDQAINLSKHHQYNQHGDHLGVHHINLPYNHPSDHLSSHI